MSDAQKLAADEDVNEEDLEDIEEQHVSNFKHGFGQVGRAIREEAEDWVTMVGHYNFLNNCPPPTKHNVGMVRTGHEN